MTTALRALNRFGMGARPGEAAGLGDPRSWLLEQLDGPPEPAADPTGAERAAGALRTLGRAARAGDREALREARKAIREIAAAEAAAGLERRMNGDRPFLERLTAFWSNHLCVSVKRGARVAVLAGSYEREAIRPHLLGRYETMLLASVRHPAMLFYLDNAASVGPNARAVRRRSRGGGRRGLNENYARELLELHTLGVDGGYDQGDVEELARVLTGWTVEGIGPAAGDEEAVRFRFREAWHEPGARGLLGRRYPEAGITQGESVLRDLARHPSTARHLAEKLVRHFVADRPDPEDVERVASIYRDTEGDLGRVARALVELPSAWDPDRRKFRAPQDWLVALLRALGVRRASAPLPGVLAQLRQGLWAPDAPAGYGDRRTDWADPDALLNRAELARSVARRLAGEGGRPRRAALAPPSLLGVVEDAADDPLRPLLADASVPAEERLALGFASPAFQWR